MSAWKSPLIAVALACGSLSCTKDSPYRSVDNQDLRPCRPSHATCASASPEVSIDLGAEYELYFVEFDDQGWLHSTSAGQLDRVMARLRAKAENNTDLSI